MHLKNKIFVGLLVVSISFLGFVIPGELKISNDFLQESFLTGKSAPDFTLKDIKGKNVKLSSFKGKVIILDFWATWCPPCRAEIPSFVELQKQYQKKGLSIIGIALDDNEKVKKFAGDYGINYTLLIGSEKVQNQYGGVTAIPTTFVIGKDFKIKKQYVGLIGKEVFEKDILELF
jgi:cytochrome c biogenesis protein CcmG/thiol:disulfide interchange protein DsbE